MIKEAAILRRSDRKVWTGRRHSNVIRKIIDEEGEQTVVSHEFFIQGFVTDKGKFVDRHDAFIIARDCGQIKAEPWAEPTLLSEDLY